MFDLSLFLQLMTEVLPLRLPPPKESVVLETITLDLFVGLNMLLDLYASGLQAAREENSLSTPYLMLNLAYL